MNDGMFSVALNGIARAAGVPTSTCWTYQLKFTGTVGSNGQITGNRIEDLDTQHEKGNSVEARCFDLKR